MNASQASRAAGLTVLLALNGESLTLGASQVTGLVNRRVAKMRDGLAARDGQLDFNVMGMSEIEALITTIPDPKAGDTLIDSFGFRHRIRYVMHTDITWVLYCTPSKTP